MIKKRIKINKNPKKQSIVKVHNIATDSTSMTQKTSAKPWPPKDVHDEPPTSMKRPSLKISDVISKKRKTNDLKPPKTIFLNKTKKVDIKLSPKSISVRQNVVGSADIFMETEDKKTRSTYAPVPIAKVKIKIS